MTPTGVPSFRHGQAQRTGILLVNLGTPEAPTPSALRRYLGQFLSDSRVVEIPRLVWMPILHGVILRVRPRKSALKYASIWTPDGSPLRVWTDKQAKLLQGWLGEHGAQVRVRSAMRYGEPAIGRQLDALCAEGAVRILVLPLYPQYSGATTASAMDDVARWMQTRRNLPELRAVARYGDDRGYIGALADSIQAHWHREGRPDKLVMSFHGMPRRTLDLGDPYHCECHKTARLLAERLALTADRWQITFQSRFGRAEWLQPYTEPTLVELARQGVKRVDVVCPGFVSDCIETLEEIAMEAKTAFLGAGGQVFHYIPCLNDRPTWVAALGELALRHMQGWPLVADDTQAVAALQAQKERALAMGAIQ